MNNARRKLISNAEALLHQALDLITEAHEGESQAADTLEEHFPGSERAELAAEYVAALEEAAEDVDSLIDKLTNIREGSL